MAWGNIDEKTVWMFARWKSVYAPTGFSSAAIAHFTVASIATLIGPA